MNNRIANDLIRYAELVEDGALISPEEMNCASLMRLAAEALMSFQDGAQPAVAEQHKHSAPHGEPVAWAMLHDSGDFIDAINPEEHARIEGDYKHALYTHPPVPTAQPKEPEQEPVALEVVYETIIQWDEGGGKRSRRELARRIVGLYTTPPQRTAAEGEDTRRAWVGLTGAEVLDVLVSVDKETVRLPSMLGIFARAIEAKLKEKNTRNGGCL